MSLAISRRTDISTQLPYFGPDGLYRPPVQEGVEVPLQLPGHMELPEENGEIVENFREQPQGYLLDQGIWPTLERIHPDRHFAVGHDCGIYWLLADPPERGAICPDWFYVAGVPPDLNGHYRRSYVLWKEHIPPTVMIEYASDDGSKERDQTPRDGKYWIYENAVRGLYYAIFVVETGDLEVYRLDDQKYRRLKPDERGHYLIEPLGAKLGAWHGFYFNETAPWLRWYDKSGKLLPIAEERALDERRRADDERRRADDERRRADEAALTAETERHKNELLAAKLRELGIDPEQL
jgi:hypothetical protein